MGILSDYLKGRAAAMDSADAIMGEDQEAEAGSGGRNRARETEYLRRGRRNQPSYFPAWLRDRMEGNAAEAESRRLSKKMAENRAREGGYAQWHKNVLKPLEERIKPRVERFDAMAAKRMANHERRVGDKLERWVGANPGSGMVVRHGPFEEGYPSAAGSSRRFEYDPAAAAAGVYGADAASEQAEADKYAAARGMPARGRAAEPLEVRPASGSAGYYHPGEVYMGLGLKPIGGGTIDTDDEWKARAARAARAMVPRGLDRGYEDNERVQRRVRALRGAPRPTWARMAASRDAESTPEERARKQAAADKINGMTGVGAHGLDTIIGHEGAHHRFPVDARRFNPFKSRLADIGPVQLLPASYPAYIPNEWGPALAAAQRTLRERGLPLIKDPSRAGPALDELEADFDNLPIETKRLVNYRRNHRELGQQPLFDLTAGKLAPGVR